MQPNNFYYSWLSVTYCDVSARFQKAQSNFVLITYYDKSRPSGDSGRKNAGCHFKCKFIYPQKIIIHSVQNNIYISIINYHCGSKES